MNVEEQQEHQKLRRQFWMQAWLAVAASSNCRDKPVPADWADRALKDFDQRFNPETE